MLVAGLVLAGIAALLHVYIFVLESVRWEASRTRGIFGTSAEEAAATKQLAYNQGFYNLFLAIGTFVGVALVAADQRAVGATLVIACAGSMALAAAVLVTSSRERLRSALVQGLAPLLGVVLVVAGLV